MVKSRFDSGSDDSTKQLPMVKSDNDKVSWWRHKIAIEQLVMVKFDKGEIIPTMTSQK